MTTMTENIKTSMEEVNKKIETAMTDITEFKELNT